MASGNTQYYLNKNRIDEIIFNAKAFKSSQKPKVVAVKNGIILPAHDNPNRLWGDGGVLDENGNYLEASTVSEGTVDDFILFGGKYDYDKKSVDYIDEEVVFFGPFIKHWGHFLCDEIGRMWYIKDNPKKYKIAYCGWNWHQGNGDLHGNYLELLTILGCNENQFINIQKPTRFKKVIIPGLAFSGARKYFTEEFMDLIDKIVRNALRNPIDTPSKIYFSRSKFARDKERGEDKIEKVFRANGFNVFYPEELDVKTQINYFNNAEEIAMVAGSISHNLLFTKNSNLQATLLNKIGIINEYQLGIDQISKAKLTYIDTYFNPRQVLLGMGPFLLSANHYFRHYLKDRNYKNIGLVPISLSDLQWYFKKFNEVYNRPDYHKLLESQRKSVAAQKRSFKKLKKSTS